VAAGSIHGNLIRTEDLEDYLGRKMDSRSRSGPAALRPATPQAIALRILNNLRNSALSSSDHVLAIRALDFMVVLVPTSPTLWHERGLASVRRGGVGEGWPDSPAYFSSPSVFLEIAWSAVKGEDVRRLAISPEERRALNILR